jgi:hypothetical protein
LRTLLLGCAALMFATRAAFPNARHLVLQFAPRVRRARRKKLARLLRTKQQLAWLCEMPPTRGYPGARQCAHRGDAIRMLLNHTGGTNTPGFVVTGLVRRCRP